MQTPTPSPVDVVLAEYADMPDGEIDDASFASVVESPALTRDLLAALTETTPRPDAYEMIACRSKNPYVSVQQLAHDLDRDVQLLTHTGFAPKPSEIIDAILIMRALEADLVRFYVDMRATSDDDGKLPELSAIIDRPDADSDAEPDYSLDPEVEAIAQEINDGAIAGIRAALARMKREDDERAYTDAYGEPRGTDAAVPCMGCGRFHCDGHCQR